MPAFKRTDWNGIIQQVNDVLQNPPTGCDPLPTIEEVGLKHRWSKADIQEVQDALISTCPDITFEAIPELWKQSIIDEITDAIGQAWCDCDCDLDPIPSEDGLEFTFFTQGAGPLVDPPDEVLLSSLINGLTLGEPGIDGRTWAFFERVNLGGNEIESDELVIQPLPCDGIVFYSGNEMVGISTIGEDITFSYHLRLHNP